GDQSATLLVCILQGIRRVDYLSCRASLLRLARLEQPVMNVICDSLQPRITDRLAVDAAHVGYFMPHDEIACGLILCLVGDGAEGVTERVESEAFSPIDTELAE